MAAKVTFKSMDYFKFRKYIIDKDDSSSSCGKEVTSLCACVHTLNMRDDKFDDGEEEATRLQEIFASYKQILAFKRVEAVDVRLKSGWWGDQKSGLSVGKVKPAMLKDVLVAKCKDWNDRHEDGGDGRDAALAKTIEGPGVYVFKHKEKSCFQQVFACTDNIFTRCSELFKATFDATAYSPLSSLLIISLVNDWDFYYIPSEGIAEVLKVLQNDTILKHDTLWPHGLNVTLSIETPFDIKQFRESCVRHNWPPERVLRPSKVQSIDPGRLKLDQKRLQSQPPTLRSPLKNSTSPSSPPYRPHSARPNSIGNSSNVASSAVNPKSPVSSRPSTAHPRHQKLDEKSSNGSLKKEVSDSRKTCKSTPKQETNSLKRNSRSIQNIRKDSSYSETQTKEERKPQAESTHKSNETSERKVVTQETKKVDEQKTDETEVLKCENVVKSASMKELIKDGHTNGDRKEDKSVDKKDEELNDDEFFEVKPLKRSGTFTLSDSEEDKQTATTNESTLTSRAVMAAKQLNSQNNAP